MIQKICNHCGRLYTDVCPCKAARRRKYEYKSDDFYNSKAWRSLSRYIRQRDLNSDRLAMYLSLSGAYRQVNIPGHIKTLVDYLILPGGAIRRLSGLIVVHHIIPREDDRSLWYVVDNLISLRHDVHEYIHQLYKTEAKCDIQELLREAVAWKL